MKRRDFLKTAGLATAAGAFASVPPNGFSAESTTPPTAHKPKRMTAYYFMGQDLCLVRRHLRADMEWMKAIGTDAVAIGIHEFQLNYGRAMQLDILFEEARRAGVGVFAIPSRWGGLVAGWPPRIQRLGRLMRTAILTSPFSVAGTSAAFLIRSC